MHRYYDFLVRYEEVLSQKRRLTLTSLAHERL